MECLIVDDIDKMNWRNGTRTAETIFSKGRREFPFISPKEKLNKIAPPSPFYSKNHGFNRTISTITGNDNR